MRGLHATLVSKHLGGVDLILWDVYSCPVTGFQAILNADFFVHIVEVAFNRMLTDEQHIGNVGVGGTFANQGENLALTLG